MHTLFFYTVTINREAKERIDTPPDAIGFAHQQHCKIFILQFHIYIVFTLFLLLKAIRISDGLPFCLYPFVRSNIHAANPLLPHCIQHFADAYISRSLPVIPHKKQRQRPRTGMCTNGRSNIIYQHLTVRITFMQFFFHQLCILDTVSMADHKHRIFIFV